jgi:putative GTP pyrophosphokinase
LDEVTDIVGIRVITHFEDEVDRIGSLIEREFAIDRVNSVDKRKALDPDRFGYLSLHYVCGLNNARLALSENKGCEDLKCEIQVRSILQHAWAEIEHDLGYKSNNAVPAPIRRRFSRLAGMLEIADVEFSRLRKDLNSYEATVAERMETSRGPIEIDAVSLRLFIRRDPSLKRLDSQMARTMKAPLSGALDEHRFVDHLRYLGLGTIDQLAAAIKRNAGLVLFHWRRMIRDGALQYRSLPNGVGLFQLFQLMVAGSTGSEEAAKVLGQFHIGPSDVIKAVVSRLRQSVRDYAKKRQSGAVSSRAARRETAKRRTPRKTTPHSSRNAKRTSKTRKA